MLRMSRMLVDILAVLGVTKLFLMLNGMFKQQLLYQTWWNWQILCWELRGSILSTSIKEPSVGWYFLCPVMSFHPQHSSSHNIIIQYTITTSPHSQSSFCFSPILSYHNNNTHLTHTHSSPIIYTFTYHSNYASLSLHNKYMPLCRDDGQWRHSEL